MSGHSHWSGIKHKKEITDSKRSKVFSKIAKEITIAAKGGGDINFNSKLRLVVEKARSFNMPTDNIGRAIKKGTGEIEGEALENVVFEAYGPGEIALIIEGITDNKNRLLGEIKQILTKNNGKLVGKGGIQWMFEKKGCLIVKTNESKTKEDWEMLLIDLGAEDISWHDDIVEVYVEQNDLEKVKTLFEEKHIEIESASLDWVAKKEIEVDKETEEKCFKLFDSLDESDSIQEIYSNLKK